MEHDQIKVNTQTLDTDSQTVLGYLKDIEKQKGNVASSMIELNRMWSGPAYDQFVAVVSDDLTRLDLLLENLKKIYNYEQRAKTEYEKCESQIKTMIDDLKIKEGE